MLFARFANWVVKNHRKIVVAWIVILLLSIYPMMHIQDVVVYEEVGMGPGNTEAAMATKLINEKFPSAVPNSTAILVLRGDDINKTAVRNFTLELEKKVEERKLRYMDQFMSIYKMYEMMLPGVVSSTVANLHGTAPMLEQGVNQSATLYYGMPKNFILTLNYTNFTASLVYGIPLGHKVAWDMLGMVPDPKMRDDMAYNLTLSNLGMMMGSGVSHEEMSLVYGYYNLTCGKWNSTRSDPVISKNSTVRAQKSIDDSIPTFANTTKEFGSPDAKAMLYSVWKFWTVGTWHFESDYGIIPTQYIGNNLPRLNEFANHTVYSNMILMLGQYAGAIPPSQAVQFLSYHNITMEYWGNHTTGFSNISSLTPKIMISIMERDIENSSAQFLDTVLAKDPVNKGFALCVLGNFSMSDWNDTGKIRNVSLGLMDADFVLEMMGQNFQVGGIHFTLKQLHELFDLGAAPSNAQLAAYVHDIIMNGTYGSYPMSLSADYASNFISADNRTMLISITFTKSSSYREKSGFEMSGNIRVFRELVLETKKICPIKGVAAYVTGDIALSADLSDEAFKDVEKIDPITVGLIIGLIALFFMSIVTPFVPLMVMGFAIVVSQGVLYLVGKLVAGIHYSVTTLLFVMILGAGCDYCIFIIARYREERRQGREKEEAVRTSLTWAGESIATSGITVIIGFGALSVGSFSLMRTMGLVLAMAIGVALMIALTLLPSIILLLGNRIFWPSKNIGGKTWWDSRKKKDEKKHGKSGGKSRKGGYFANAARFSIKHAKAIVVVSILITVPTTWAVINFQSSFDFIAAMPKTESTEGMKAMGDGFGEGNIMKTYVVIHFPRDVYNSSTKTFDTRALDSVDNLSGDIITRVPGIEKIESSIINSGTRVDNSTYFDSLSDANKTAAVRKSLGVDNRTVLLTVVLKEEPFSRPSMNSIASMRNLVAEEKNAEPTLSGAAILVGGSTADLKDVQKVTDDDFQKMIVIVVIGIFIVLLVVLGSVLIPLRLILTISLSISWTLAMTMVIFEYVRGIPLLWLMPMILFVVMMGLGMDYDIFLCTRMREEVSKGASDVKAIVTAVERTGGIITACGAIMAGALGSMMLSSMGLLQEFGFALFFAILIDATIVRIYLVPAIMVLLQKWNWWAPGPLQRVKRDRQKKHRINVTEEMDKEATSGKRKGSER